MKLSLTLSILLLFAGCVSVSMPDGYGTYTYYNGEYSGEWLNGKKNGKGIYRWTKSEWAGDKYEGEFKNDIRHGYGIYTFSGGSIYKGLWKDDLKHGKGLLIYGPESEWVGHKYEGEFKNDIRHGYGIYTFSDGAIYKGLWKENYQTVGIEYRPNGDTFNIRHFNGLTGEAIGDYYYADGNAVKDAYFKNGVLVEANYTKPDGEVFNTRFVGDEVIVKTNDRKGLKTIGNIISGFINVGLGLALMKAEYEAGKPKPEHTHYKTVKDCKYSGTNSAGMPSAKGRYVCKTKKVRVN